MEGIGGNHFFKNFTVLICMTMFMSCDKSHILNINDIKNYSIDCECGNIFIGASGFSNSVFIGQHFNGNYTVLTDSLKIEFNPESIKMKDIVYVMDKKNITDTVINVNNNAILLCFNLYSNIPYGIDTSMMYILPCSYIMCNGKPLITDTIRISLRDNRGKRVVEMKQ
jgi:hypothetical protein